MDLFTEPATPAICTVKDVYKAVKHLFDNYEYKLTNTFIFAWESDFFAISKSGYSLEVEVKVSKSDFKRDFTHKVKKHELFKNHKKKFAVEKGYSGAIGDIFINDQGKKERAVTTNVDYVEPEKLLPNKFYYACPEGLILPEEVPSYAGLIYTNPHSPSLQWFRIVKPASFLHKHKRDFTGILLGKYYFKHNELKINFRQFLNNYQYQLTDEQKDFLKRIIVRLD